MDPTSLFEGPLNLFGKIGFCFTYEPGFRGTLKKCLAIYSVYVVIIGIVQFVYCMIVDDWNFNELVELVYHSLTSTDALVTMTSFSYYRNDFKYLIRKLIVLSKEGFLRTFIKS